MPSADGVRPRTTEERRAWIAGYAAALDDVNMNGLRAAAKELKVLAVEEGMLDEAVGSAHEGVTG